MELTPVYPVHFEALHTALGAALPGKYMGLGYAQTSNGLLLTVVDNPLYNDADTVTIQSVVAAHDPVILTVDKTAIVANGVDAATVTVKASRPDAAAVTLLVSSKTGVVEWPIALVNGAGTDTLTAVDPDTIMISLKTPDNRSTDTLTIIAR